MPVANVPLRPGSSERVAQLFRNGRSRAVRIPKEFDLAGDSVILSQQPDGSIVLRTAETAGLLDYLRTAEPWTGGEFVVPADAADLPPLRTVDFD